MDSFERARRTLRRQLGELDRPVYAVGGGQFVNAFGSGVVYPFAVLYFVEEVGIAFTLVGAGLFANNLTRAVGTAAGGVFADRIGRVPVMVASMALSAVALASYALVTTAAGFLVVAAASGLVSGLYTPAGQAYVADRTTGTNRERAYGLLKVAGNAGFGLGFVAGGVLFGVLHVAIFLVDGATSGVVAAIFLLGLPRDAFSAEADGAVAGNIRAELGRWGRVLVEPRMRHLVVLNIGFAIAYAQMQSTIPVFAQRTLALSSEQIGTLFVLNPLVLVLFQLPAVSLLDGWRRTRGLVLSAGFWAASFLAVLAAYWTSAIVGVGLLAGFVILRTIGEILHAPLATALASDLGRTGDRGSRLSALEVAKRFGFGIGPLVGGVFFDIGLEMLLWPGLVGLCLLIAVGALLLEPRVTASENGVVVGGS